MTGCADSWGWSLLIQLPFEKPRNYHNGHQTTSLLINTEVSKLVIKGRGEVVKCGVYSEKSKMNTEKRLLSYLRLGTPASSFVPITVTGQLMSTSTHQPLSAERSTSSCYTTAVGFLNRPKILRDLLCNCRLHTRASLHGSVNNLYSSKSSSMHTGSQPRTQIASKHNSWLRHSVLRNMKITD